MRDAATRVNGNRGPHTHPELREARIASAIRASRPTGILRSAQRSLKYVPGSARNSNVELRSAARPARSFTL